MLTYGRSAASIGEQLGKTKDEAQEIIDKFFNAFPNVKKWIDDTHNFCRKNKYVVDIAGRRRHLDDIALPEYSFTDLSKKKENIVNLFLFSSDKEDSEFNKKVKKYESMLSKMKSDKDYKQIQDQAKKENIRITKNGGFIAEAERQSVNSIIQGSAASLTKYALLTIYRDERMKEIGAYLINTVHDEILMEVPEENSQLCEQYLKEDMINSAKKFLSDIPMDADTYNVKRWYEDEMQAKILDKLKDLRNEINDEAEVKNKLYAKFGMLPKEIIDSLLSE